MLSVTAFYAYMLGRKERQLKHKEAGLTEHSLKTLEVAQKKALHLVEHATHKADDMIQDTKTFETALDRQIKELVVSAGEKIAGRMDILISQSENLYVQELGKLVLRLQEVEKANTAVAASVIQQYRISLDEYLKTKIDTEFAASAARIKEFEEAEKKRIIFRAEDKLSIILKEALGRALTTEEHETLVLSAITKAKSEQFI
ncbi:hypothetical protein HGB07_08090 [Candidatus Roizmanbacteria bacterium]|nr:hypothetical protein [Candidatus Roizmanbacteria bacterium]